MCNIALILLLQLSASQACFWGRQLTKEDCEDFPSNNDGCMDVYQGRLQATEMTADLYKSVSRDVTVDQANVFLIPIEIGRIISILIHGTDNHGQKQESLKQVGCYVNKLNSELLASIQVDFEKIGRDDEENDKKRPQKKMLSLQRNAFIDEELSANESFSKKALCWFDVGMQPEDFSDKTQLTQTVNDWAVKAVQRSKIAIDESSGNATASSPLNPLAYSSDIFSHDKVVIVASSFVKIPWKNGLFYKEDTVMDASFLVAPNELHSQGRKVGVRVAMMTTKGSFKVLEKEKFTALALPMDPTFIDSGEFIVILPKENVPLFQVEEEVAASGITLFNIIEGFLSYKLPHKIVEVQLPRLNLQIMHEWSTPASKQIVEITDDDGKTLEGDMVGVYQDVQLEMIETEGTAFLDADIESRNTEAQLQFIVNRPFMFMVKMDHELIGLGRVLDPHWCKLCSPKTRNYMQTDTREIVDTFEQDSQSDYGLLDENDDYSDNVTTTVATNSTEFSTTTTTEPEDENPTTTTNDKAETTPNTTEEKTESSSTTTTKGGEKGTETEATAGKEDSTVAKNSDGPDRGTEKNDSATTKLSAATESDEESESQSDEQAEPVVKIDINSTTTEHPLHKKSKKSKMSSLLDKMKHI